ncbi:MAG: TerC family protein [Xanthomonadaceae bacterium]|nr:TerC family protein [Xanthomonadaceae bacterium]MDE1885825.1 TerC family protein [Xanthomonadaceae bacterium]MDE1961702.1 TerC family protein [Xanthomonadaceae bacterium]MDE2085324.1 TerC family protein [Xanthomonadaceae bacterium]MDE2258139.1 TerC family protein [Xanthomonadaceae bacterium]
MSFLQGELLIALLTLSTLEIVLGVDNLVFISIAVGRLPEARRSLARRLGLSFACLTRIALLLVLAHLARMDDTHAPLFHLGAQIISVRDLIMTGGGVFLLVKGSMEIHEAIYGVAQPPSANAAMAAFVWVIVQIALIDIVFSLDSVITAVGMVRNIPVMVAAIVLAVLVMIFAADPVGEFIDNNPTIRMLALAFIMMIGVMLIGEGFAIHIPRGYIYFAMAFSAVVELLNLAVKRQKKKHLKRRADDSGRETL